MTIKKIIWIDDIRDPFTGDWLKRTIPFHILQENPEVIWCKSYDEFVDFLNNNAASINMDEVWVSFDHDLGKATEKYFLLQGYTKKEARAMKGKELTGYDCAKYMIYFIIDRELTIPQYSVHSSNPVGRDNIISYIESFKKSLTM